VGFSGFPPDVVLGGRISNGREKKSWKREGEEVEEPRCCSLELTRADPCGPCLGLARLTPFSRPMSAEERENCEREKRKRRRSHDAVRRSSPMPVLAAHAWVHDVGLPDPDRGVLVFFFVG
jgi:hypothetical protein